MKLINYSQTPKFGKDFKKLLKRFRTLEEDFKTMKESEIEIYHLKKGETNAVVPMQEFCGQDYLSMKVKKMACKSLKGKGNRSGLRVTYVFEQKENKITFIEMYYKSDQENESRERLSAFIEKIDNIKITKHLSHTNHFKQLPLRTAVCRAEISK
ncbi:MAG: hypothetical protein LBN19_01265 [Endomicrobium sp.]|jgi:hypothetical protein|nr:hypothetical protein [Endomicrobium sp.]